MEKKMKDKAGMGEKNILAAAGILIGICMLMLAGCGDAVDKKESVMVSEESQENQDLFNSQGVALEILAEGRELDQEMHDAFLRKFGFEGAEPFYEYVYTDGDPDVELYYDEERKVGCGFKYWANASGPVVCGYAFDHCDQLSWCEPDPFACVSAYGTTGESGVVDYQEEYEYDDEGKLTHFISTGRAWEDDPPETLIEISFAYDGEGRLKKRKYWHNTAGRYPFGSFLASQYSYYDDDQRLLYINSYTTSGYLDSYFIYEGDNEVPAYYFELNNQYTAWPALYEIQQSEYTWEDIQAGKQNWTWVILEQEPKENSSEEEVMTEQEWLDHHDFTEDNLFYRYEFSAEESDYELTFYCAEDKESGGGILKRNADTKYAFTFDGSEKYLTYPVGPFTVYSEYSDGKETTFLHGENIVEHFEEMEDESGQDFTEFGYSEDGRLLHMREDRLHGCVWRFYLYEKDGEGRTNKNPDYMLELDVGWGAAFYRFD